ncbi:MAG: alkaline phosphatase family protein [Bacteroides sp.]|nr:alkaline phosphatase family protein [Bacteroides sp.]
MNLMKSYRNVLAAACIAAAAVSASAADGRPQLAVGIVVDGLDPQYIDLLAPYMGEGGFNRLSRRGVAVANADYGTNLDLTATAAMLMTGADPVTTAVTGSTIYDPEAMRALPAMHDAAAVGNFTDQTFSPRTLAVSTLTDECRIAGGGVTRAYAIAADPSVAVTLAGHSANAALWLNQRTGNWATSTYYKDPPTTLTRRNRVSPLAVRLDTMQWAPVAPAESYPGLPEHLTHYKFRYVFPRGNDHRYALFAASPLVNTEVTDMAIDLIGDLRLGSSDGVDMVNVAYSLRPYDYTRSSDNRYELMDSYLRLDRDIARLIDTVESTLGSGNAVYYLAATPAAPVARRDPEEWGVPYGEFSTKKARSLLNICLMGAFGNGEWVSAFHGNQFYLNHKLIKDRGLDAKTVRAEAAALLARMSGVDRVYTIDQILTGRSDVHADALRRGIHPESAGDLYLEVDPGWELVDDMVSPASPERTRYVRRYSPATAPVYILAPGIAPHTVAATVDARRIAPTVARLLRIRRPNASALPALVF